MLIKMNFCDGLTRVLGKRSLRLAPFLRKYKTGDFYFETQCTRTHTVFGKKD